MRAVIQRVTRAAVTVDEQVVGQIGRGFLVLLGAADGDTEEDSRYLARKTSGLRVFEDEEGKMNRALGDVDGQVLAVSQFTLLGSCHKGRRPAFTSALAPEPAKRLYEHYVQELRGHGLTVETGVFQAMMQVELVNDGPVTLLIDSRKVF